MLLRLILLPLTVLSFIIQTSAQPTELPAFLQDSLDTYVERALRQWQIPGVAVGIVKDGHLVLAKGYGVRELGKPGKVDANTLFMIGSNTKAFTGTALAMLEADGKCTMDDKVKKWLPRFDMLDNWVENEVNLADLVSHRIGLETFQGDFMYWTSDLSQEQVLEKFGKLKPVYGFRSKWGYTNAGFLAAGMCIEKISGKRWEDYLREQIFQPLGMNRTLALSTEIETAENAARAHSLDGEKLILTPYGNIDNLAPAGSIASSVEDMSHWIIAHLDGGRYQGKEVIPARAIDRTREPLSIEGRRRTTNTGIRRHYALYGMGWELSDYDGRELVSHTGGVNGFVTSVTLVPEENLGIMVFTNTDANGFYMALMREILDAWLGMPYHNYSALYLQGYEQNRNKELETLQRLRDTISANPKTFLPLGDYAGRYDNDAYGWIDMKPDGKNLKVTFQHHSKLRGKLEPIGGNRFLLSFNDVLFGVKPVRFNVEDGKVRDFVLRVADFLEFTTYEFVKRE
jgi:CubicO group peptidase (beta-lactamase class C family)